MPTYQYACNRCGHRFDIVQGFHDDALQVCPDCGESALRKLFGNVGVVFKGSGFYRNDSRTSGAKAGGGKGSGASTPKSDSAGASDSGASSSATKGGTTPAAPASSGPSTT